MALLPVPSPKNTALIAPTPASFIEPSVVSRQKYSRLNDRPTYGNPIDFRGLRHEPVNEQGVVFLFGIVAKELGYMVEAVQTGYPDCEAKRQVEGGRGKELESSSSLNVETSIIHRTDVMSSFAGDTIGLNALNTSRSLSFHQSLRHLQNLTSSSALARLRAMSRFGDSSDRALGACATLSVKSA